MTDAEALLWRYLRNRQINNYKFRRQHPIGRYIIDFVCLEKKLIIELDGGQHADQINYDENRSRWLEGEGYKVIRFWNNDIFDHTEVVLQEIYDELVGKTPHPHPGPLPQGERV